MYVSKRTWLEQGPRPRPCTPGWPVAIAVPCVRGLGDVSQYNPYAGTYDDINCPGKCFVAGNVMDQWLFGKSCWPCHNVCAPGSVWDLQTESCRFEPAAPNPVQPVIPQTPTDTTVQAITGSVSSVVPWVVGGLAAVLILPAVLGGGRRR